VLVYVTIKFMTCRKYNGWSVLFIFHWLNIFITNIFFGGCFRHWNKFNHRESLKVYVSIFDSTFYWKHRVRILSKRLQMPLKLGHSFKYWTLKYWKIAAWINKSSSTKSIANILCNLVLGLQTICGRRKPNTFLKCTN